MVGRTKLYSAAEQLIGDFEIAIQDRGISDIVQNICELFRSGPRNCGKPQSHIYDGDVGH